MKRIKKIVAALTTLCLLATVAPVDLSVPAVAEAPAGSVDVNATHRASAAANAEGDNNGVGSAFDSNSSTYWQGSGTGENWISVTFDDYYSVGAARLEWNSIYATGSCTLDTSVDGIDWVTAYTFTPSSNAAIDMSFTAVTAKYVRLMLNGSTDGKYAPEVTEFKVYGVQATAPSGAAAMASTTDRSRVKILGKALRESKSGTDGYTFTYGASGIAVNFVGTELEVYVTSIGANDNKIDVMISVDTDMPMEATKMTLNQTGWVTVASGLENKQHTVKVQKMARGFYGIMAADNLSLGAVRTDNTLLAASPDSDLVIEVYGDSITNGDGTWLNSDGSNSSWTAASYSTVVARLLGAESRVTGNTGNGLCGWVMTGGSSNLMLENLLPPQKSWSIYDPQYNNSAYSHAGDNAADVVIINLGTNDRGEYGIDLSRKTFADEYVRFIKEIKTDCPDAIVICTLGAMGGIEQWQPCIAGSGSDYYRYTYTRLEVKDNAVEETPVTAYVEASLKSQLQSVINAHTANPTGANGTYTVSDVQAVNYDVVIKKNSYSIDANASHDDCVLTQCNNWAGEEFVFWTQLAQDNSVSGYLGYDNGHPSNFAHENYALQIASIINDKLNLGVDLPAMAQNGGTSAVSKVVAQKSANGEDNRVRLVAAVNNLDHDKVGFRITVTDENGTSHTTELKTTRVYGSISGVTASALGKNGGYMFSAVVDDIPANAKLTVTAFALDGSTYTLGNGGVSNTIAFAGNQLTVR